MHIWSDNIPYKQHKIPSRYPFDEKSKIMGQDTPKLISKGVETFKYILD